MAYGTKLVIPIDNEILEQLRESAQEWDLPVATLVRQLIRQHLGLQSVTSFRGPSAPAEKPASTEKRPVGRPRINPPKPDPNTPICPIALRYKNEPITKLPSETEESADDRILTAYTSGARWQDAAGNLYNDQGDIWDEQLEMFTPKMWPIPDWFRFSDEANRPVDIGGGQ